MVNISVEDLSDVVNEELTLYSQNIIDGIKAEAKSHIAELVRKTRETAPVGERSNNKYKDSIASKKVLETHRDISYLWYVKGSNYRLSHLLENGHATRNGGRVQGSHFISRATEEVVSDYISKVEEVIRNG